VDEREGTFGASHLAEILGFKSTKSSTAMEMRDRLEKMGGMVQVRSLP